jgi:hypothetical protein
MRALLILLVSLGLFTAAHAADSTTGRLVKVLPFLLDAQGRDALSPSLFDRDAYQAQLRANTNEVSALRYDVLWQAAKSGGEKFTLRAELRAVGERGVPLLKTLETEVTPGTFRKWTSLTLGGAEYKKFGAVVAWRITLWRGGRLLDEKKSFLW